MSTDEVNGLYKKIRAADHDEQHRLMVNESTETLRTLMFLISEHQNAVIKYIQDQNNLSCDLHLIIEATYTWAICTTILRTRCAYGRNLNAHTIVV